jgi:hypothetical protein
VTHILTLDDWDSDGDVGDPGEECRRCGADRTGSHLCWFCDEAWIWSDAP